MTKELAIAFTIPSIARRAGGPVHAVTKLAQVMAKRPEWAVHLVARVDPREAQVIPSAEVHTHAMGPGMLAALRQTPGVLGQIAGRQSVVLHDYGIWHPLSWAFTRFASTHGVPYVISTCGMLQPWALRFKRHKKRVAWRVYQRRLLEGAGCLFATSAMEAESLRAAGLKTPIATIPHGANTDIPLLPRKAENGLRTALCLSRLHPVKGLKHAIEAWARLRPRDWRLKIVGPSEAGHREQLEALVRQHGLQDSVVFAGAKSGEDKYRCLREADLFLLPSYSENFGVAVLEALASEVPVVTTVGTPWKELPEIGCGWWIDIGTEPLVATLEGIFTMDTAVLRGMGETGRQWIAQRFDWEHVADQKAEVYRWLLKLGPKPDCVEF